MRRFVLTVLLAVSSASAQTNTVSSLRALYVQDQRDRGVALADDGRNALPKSEADKPQTVDMAKEVPARDAARREQARALLAMSGLTGADYYYAAYLFQHGDKPDDYLFAHILATQAVAMGNTRAKWISAATLDRYLQAIGQKQVFGTQFLDENYAYYLEHQHDPDVVQKYKTMSSQQTLAPYNQQLLTDTIRRSFCVPPLAAQQQHITDVKAGKAAPGDLPGLSSCEK